MDILSKICFMELEHIGGVLLIILLVNIIMVKKYMVGWLIILEHIMEHIWKIENKERELILIKLKFIRVIGIMERSKDKE
jgi:hypothetical protein